MGCKRHNRYTFCAGFLFPLADGPRGFKPVHIRHRTIHEHHVIAFGLHGLKGRAAIHDRVARQVKPAQGLDDHLAVYGVVICHQHQVARIFSKRVKGL